MLNTMETERFFAELVSRMDTARRTNRRRYRRFFAELAPRLDTARALDIELDRHLARRFNVFDYAKTDELGLSKILADLLDPHGPHGQGALFLERFVKRLGKPLFRPNLSDSRNSVVGRLVHRKKQRPVEHVITANRRIDIYIQIGDGDAAHCLAIENKPYAGDQKNQVKDYLEYLWEQYGERFVLIYLSPTGEGPSNWSIPEKELGKWHGQFAILPYCTVDSERDHDAKKEEPDGFEAFRLSNSLADWFKQCRRACEVDRLRWFLRDAEVFCQRTFGDPTMTTKSETKVVRDFLLSNPENLAIARTVYESWLAVKGEICKKFLKQLCRRVERKAKEEMPEFGNDVRVEYKYGGERRWVNRLWLYRTSWTKYEVEKSDSNERTTICLDADGKGPNGWYFGVLSPLSVEEMADRDNERRLLLDGALKEALDVGHRSRWWPWWKWVDERYKNWDYLIPDLHRECKEGNDGEVMEYFVDLLVGTAEKVIPIINKIEGDDA